MKLELNDLQKFFINHQIDYSYPGFYDEPNFIMLEQEDPKILELYADYINLQNYSETYLMSAKKTINSIVNFIFNELKKDGRQGACIDVCGTLMRMLEQENIWSYQIKGSLAVLKKLKNGGDFRTVMSPYNLNKKYGHSWLYAPPFKVVDPTLYMQEYNQEIKMCVDDNYLLVENKNVKNLELSQLDSRNILDPDFINLEISRNPMFSIIPTPQEINLFIKPDFFECINKYSSFQYQLNSSILLVYTPLGITAPDGSLKDIKSLCLNGQYGIDLYQKYKKQNR